MGNAQLAGYEMVIEIGGTRVAVKPHISGDSVFMNLALDTPFGPIRAVLTMSVSTFNVLTNYFSRNRIIPKLTDLLEGTFGYRPVVRR